jgi:hypothetical protein
MLLTMSFARSSLAGLLASGLLAGLTLSVFSQFQLAGPEGVMLRFLEAVQKDDALQAEALTTGPIDIRSGRMLQYLAARLNGGAGYQVEEVRRLPKEPVAFVRVTFFLANTREVTEWQLTRVNHKWYVDIENSLKLWGVTR